VHQLSPQSFNALLKSIEEPPAHVVFMMATTELHKIPDTILSRSQVFEFRTIPSKAIVGQLRLIAEAEKIEVSDAALALIARAAEGSMRDAQSALDQVMAFAGGTIAVEDVSTVLGLVGRDLLLDVVEAMIDEDGPRAFALADRAVESGHDLRLVCRELSRVVRDMMILSVDPERAGDGELADGERERLTGLARRFSREDLMRAFDLLAKTEQDIRSASHPRYHFEMMLLRWMHLRKLVPLADLLDQLGGARGGSTLKAPVAPTAKGTIAPTVKSTIAPTAKGTIAPTRESAIAPAAKSVIAPTAKSPIPPTPASSGGAGVSSAALKEALLNEIRAGKAFFYNTVVAQAQKIDVTNDAVTFTFLPAHRVLRETFDQTRAWLESTAERLTGRKIQVTALQAAALAPASGTPEAPRTAAAPEPAQKRDLKAEAMSSTAVQAMLDVFPAEIRDVEEI
jgi:DNA polymerase-3 subunit gamma/tau